MSLHRRRIWSGLLLAIISAWSFFALAFWRIADFGTPAGHPVRQALMAAVASDPALKLDIALFLAAQLLIHAALGVLIWLLALAIRRVWPQIRLGIAALTLACAAVVIAFVYVMNAAQFPWSAFSASSPLLTSTLFSTVTVADALSVCVVVAIAWIVAAALFSFQEIRAQGRRIAAYGLLAAGVFATVQALELQPSSGSERLMRPHVIVIGIDSLRPDALGRGQGIGVAPNIDAFLKDAVTFTDTTTPLARTFPSWFTILSGRHPVRSGARDNLMPPHLLTHAPTLADRMREVGYATVYATDEVRFSNIDASYGFDAVVAPKMGASDFMLGRWGDVPLSNLLVNTRVGALLFPNLYGNRGVAKTYRPDTFIDWVDRRLEFDRPTFLAMHLTLPHYPYHWAADNRAAFARTSDSSYMYLAGVLAADRQFGRMLQLLEHRGVLDNAIVLLLSDHGEGLGLSSDNLLYDRAAKDAVGKLLVSMTGHGSSVLSPTQYQVMLAIRPFGRAARDVPQGRPAWRSAPASLEDVAPTVLDLVGVPFEAGDFDGYSLADELAVAGSDPRLTSRIRFTETGLTTTFMRMGNFGDEANLQEGMKFFAVDPETSRVVFRAQRLPDLLEQKERAAISAQQLLAAIPDPEAGGTKYVLVDRAGGVPQVVTYDPRNVSVPAFARLWTALQDRFGAELGGAAE